MKNKNKKNLTIKQYNLHLRDFRTSSPGNYIGITTSPSYFKQSYIFYKFYAG